YPITQACRLGDPAADIGQPDTADQALVMGEDEEIVCLVGSPVFGIATNPGAKTRAAQCVGRPVGLPWREKISGARAQARPGLVIAALPAPQQHPVPQPPRRMREGPNQTP